MVDLEIINEQSEKEITENQTKIIERVIQKAAEVEEIGDVEVVISLVDNDRIMELNSYYRGIENPTDVLSFALNELDDEETEITYDEDIEIPNMLGDIIISIPKAEEQAKEYNHSFERELAFLAVHGFLHLVGYDHQTEVEETEMFSKQDIILNKLDITR